MTEGYFSVRMKNGKWYSAVGRSGAYNTGPRLYCSEKSAKQVASRITGTVVHLVISWDHLGWDRTVNQ